MKYEVFISFPVGLYSPTGSGSSFLSSGGCRVNFM